MNARKSAGVKQHLEIHQGGDGQPAFDPRGAGGGSYSASGLVITDEIVELDPDPDIQGEKSELKPGTGALGTVSRGADKGFLHGTISVMHGLKTIESTYVTKRQNPVTGYAVIVFRASEIGECVSSRRILLC